MVKDAVILHHSKKDSWGLFPQFLHRVKSFCKTYESDIDINALSEFLRMSFISAKPTALMIVGLDEDLFPCSHMLAIAERWFGTPCVTVVQLEADERISQAVWDQGKEALDLFCHFHQAKFVQMAARNEAVARLYRRQGFIPNRILCKRPVEGRADLTPSVIT